MSFSRSTWLIFVSWAVFVGGYAVVALLVRPGTALTAFGDIMRCLVPLFANACLLWNAGSAYRRRNAFWMLLALGCTIWLVGQMVWTYDQLVLHRTSLGFLSGDLIFFLRTVPLMGALAVQPHARRLGKTLRYGYLDLTLLGCWWVYLYGFLVAPWRLVTLETSAYVDANLRIYLATNLIIVVGFGTYFLRSSTGWRNVYAHLFGASAMYTLANMLILRAGLHGGYHTGSIYDVPLVASFVWFGTSGIVAHSKSLAPDPLGTNNHEFPQWPSQLAMIGILSLPALALWDSMASDAPAPVRQFRLVLTLVSIFLGGAMVILRQSLVEKDRLQLLRNSQEALENLRRLQTQFVQAEKLVSLGQLAAGAAHEINNPLTAILGYADVLVETGAAEERSKTIAEKIREQARRVKGLVTNLQSFARQVPAEKQLLDLNVVLSSAVQLRKLDLRDKKVRIDLHNRSVIPAVRGDPNQLLQVFYHLISNAVDAMEGTGGGVLTVRALREGASVVVEFSDTGPGLREPGRIFDPFYTTKPVGKGTGLGLSICYGIVQEHGGKIAGYNRQDCGATFRIELPAVLALFPQAPHPPAAPVSVS